ncbi:MAG: tRNA (adenosine(37)-N6)-threonylcarbamoyltransferase complex ATPase subunit type 1 TsaE [Candidatus Gribaldobacteria bacterium]|nr:tRNA (adenosine(37)-N6)-threonylcarbamoyltransferase complex ATPase subunit type 1 TsaE [Candidatus Gribaldobacteria bacterium]
MSNVLTNKKTVSASARQTQSLASKLAKKILGSQPRTGAFVLALEGDLGSGKTTFTQGLAKGLGVKDRITSPTFVVMKRFKNFYHFDCYRLQRPEEILELGWQEIIANPQNIIVIEWPEKIKKFLPKETICLKFKFLNKTQRQVVGVQ